METKRCTGPDAWPEDVVRVVVEEMKAAGIEDDPLEATDA